MNIDIVYNNGDINITLLTLLCIGFIIVFFISISILSRFSKNENDDLVDIDDNNFDNKPKQVRKKLITKSPFPKLVSKSVKVENKYSNIADDSHIIVRSNVDSVKSSKIKKDIKPKKTNQLISKPISKPINKPDITTLNKEEFEIPEAGKESITKESITKESISKESISKEVTEKEIYDEIIEDKIDIPERKSTSLPLINSKKILKIGNVQVDESIKLNDAEKNMIISMFNTNDRGRIIQLVGGTKIMNFNIDNTTQLSHIEKQISNYCEVNSPYIVYVVWESNLIHKVSLSQKLRYNPNVRYK